MIVYPIEQEEVLEVTVIKRRQIVCDETYPIIESFDTNYVKTQRTSRRKSLGNGFFVADTSPSTLPEFV